MLCSGQLEMRTDQKVVRRQVPMAMLALQTFAGVDQALVPVQTSVVTGVTFTVCRVL